MNSSDTPTPDADGRPAAVGTIRVLVAEDHPAVRAGLVAILGAAEGIEVIGQAADGTAALDLTDRLRPEVVLTDVRMPGATGIEITPGLRAHGARVLVISAFDLDAYVLGALSAGADGYLVKTEEPERIIDAVRRVASGDAVLSPATTRAVVDALRGGPTASGVRPPAADPSGVAVTGPDADPAHVPELTRREEDVLQLVAQGRSNQQIARELVVEVTTVKTHLTHVLAKLQLDSRVQAALWWHQHRG
jgi:DNA-binding NarL/FixJ family response regulator